MYDGDDEPMIPFVEDTDPKMPLDDDGDPNGVEKEPTGLAKQDRVRRVPYKKEGGSKKVCLGGKDVCSP